MFRIVKFYFRRKCRKVGLLCFHKWFSRCCIIRASVSFIRLFAPLVLLCFLGPTCFAVHVTTAECTGDYSKPVARGVDLVAYFSLAPDQPAVNGSEEYAVLFHQYTFYFSSLENMLMFEVSHTHRITTVRLAM